MLQSATDYYLALFSLRFVTLPCALNYYLAFFSRSGSHERADIANEPQTLAGSPFLAHAGKNTRGDKKFARTNAHSFPNGRKEMGQYSFFGPYLESDMLGCWLAALCSSSRVVR